MKTFFELREELKSTCPHCEMMGGKHHENCPMMQDENLDEISLDALTKKISNTGMKNVRKDMKTDKLKQDLLKMKQKAKTAGVMEKTLTPAEKKKREEIAKAIERDNPDMPMDKKMAIATAQAKKEEVEQIDESVISDLVTQTGLSPAEIMQAMSIMGLPLLTAGMLFLSAIGNLRRDIKKWKSFENDQRKMKAYINDLAKEYKNSPEQVKKDLTKAQKTPGLMGKAKSLVSFLKKKTNIKVAEDTSQKSLADIRERAK